MRFGVQQPTTHLSVGHGALSLSAQGFGTCSPAGDFGAEGGDARARVGKALATEAPGPGDALLEAHNIFAAAREDTLADRRRQGEGGKRVDLLTLATLSSPGKSGSKKSDRVPPPEQKRPLPQSTRR